MILLSGNTLGERHKQLNEKVNEATADDFTKHKEKTGGADIDKLFLIDFASKNKNIDFILEIFKSGDIVHITRAVNKIPNWIGEDEYAQHINIDNLQRNVFPIMSIKMKKKLLSTLSTVIKNENRAIAFHEYCMKENLLNIAIKFLCNTPEKFKQDIILKKSEAYDWLYSNIKDFAKPFFGNSFTLINTLLDTLKTECTQENDTLKTECTQVKLLLLMQHMYTVSSKKYLDLLEKYKISDWYFQRFSLGFGHRTSKDIMKKHKDRVLKYPHLYVKYLNKSKLARNSTIEDVKHYAVGLLPDDVDMFWHFRFYDKYKYILDIIPTSGRFSFLKKIFSEKYPGQKFEMRKEFYSCNLYELMTNEEKEEWALKHIESGDESFGNGNDFTWYKFVSFDKAFVGIKKNILMTSDESKRAQVVMVLIESAKSQDELETLLKYYHDMHINEQRMYKMKFIHRLIEIHNVYVFNHECWITFEKLLYSLDVFKVTRYDQGIMRYRAMTLIHYIIQGEVPAVLNDLLGKDDIVYDIKKCCCNLDPDNIEIVKKFMLKHCDSTVVALASKFEKTKDLIEINKYLTAYCVVLEWCSKTKDDIPDIINKFIKLHPYFSHRLLHSNDAKARKISSKDIVKHMNKDATLIITEFPLIKQYCIDNNVSYLYLNGKIPVEFVSSDIYHSCTRKPKTNWLVRKLKLYFHHDIAQQYLQLLNGCLENECTHMVNVAVYGILTLADESSKIDFVQKYVPTNPMIDYTNTPRQFVQIQKAICACAYVSRPPLPLSCIINYIAGDYLSSCLPIFQSYLMNLPLPACFLFVESLISKPGPAQNQALRLLLILCKIKCNIRA